MCYELSRKFTFYFLGLVKWVFCNDNISEICPVLSWGKDQVEEANGGGTWTVSWSWKLLRSAKDVPLAILLPTEFGVQLGSRGGAISVQRTFGPSTGSATTPRPADSSTRSSGRKRATATLNPSIWRSAAAQSATMSQTQWTRIKVGSLELHEQKKNSEKEKKL